MRKPVSYRIARQRGSHRVLISAHYPRLVFAFHDQDTIPPGQVRKILVQDVGLGEDEARATLNPMTIVRVLYHEEPEGWWAESPDVERWSAAGATFDEVRQLAEEGVRFALDDESVEVEHFVPAKV